MPVKYSRILWSVRAFAILTLPCLVSNPALLFADGRVHLILACDTLNQDARFAKDVQQDLRLIWSAFLGQLPANQLESHTLEANEFSSVAAINQVRTLNVSSDDTICFYYSGHGGFDEKAGHFLHFRPADDNRPADHLLRTELLRELAIKKARLVVLVSDSCASYEVVNRPKAFNQPRELIDPASIPRPKVASACMRSLFLVPRGVVDLNSSKPGEISSTRGDGSGAIFTYRFAMFLRQFGDRSLSWPQCVAMVDEVCQKDFRTIWPEPEGCIISDARGVRKQKVQTVKVFKTVGLAFGAQARFTGDGIQIVQVLDGSPAAEAGIVIGDLILGINGRKVESQQAYLEAIDRSPKQMELELKSSNSPAPRKVMVTLGR